MSSIKMPSASDAWSGDDVIRQTSHRIPVGKTTPRPGELTTVEAEGGLLATYVWDERHGWRIHAITRKNAAR